MNNAVRDALNRCFGDKRVVFWYDDGGKCRAEFDAVELEGVEKLVINGNEFGIKYKILSEKPDGKFLVYSDRARPESGSDWLYDLYLAGVSFSTDPASMVISEMGFPDNEQVRNAISGKLIAFFKSEARKRDVKALMNAEGESGPGGPSAEKIELMLICVLCKVKDHVKIEYVLAALLKELADGRSEKVDELAKYGLEDALWRRLGIDFGYANRTNPSVTDFANCLFHDAFLSQIKDEPYLLSHQALAFFNDWKNGTKTRQIFMKLADESAAKMSIAQQIESEDATRFGALDVYREIDERIVAALVEDVERGSARVEDVAKIIGERKDGCRYDEFANCYLAIDAAANFFSELASVDLTSIDASDAVHKYAGSWYRIDQQYRLFIENYNAARKLNAERIDLFASLKKKIDGCYIANYLQPQSVNFQKHVNALASWKFEGVKMQCDFWRDCVEPLGVNTCVIISDALRYEVAAELADRIAATHRYSAKIDPMVSVLPSYTQLGMAALLPHGKLEFYGGEMGHYTQWVTSDGKNTKGLEARKAILESVASPKSTAISYKDYMAMSSQDSRKYLGTAKVIYIYHDRIDAVGDKRESEDDVMDAVRKTVEELMAVIAKVGSAYRVPRFLITADHGFLYQDRELDESQYVADEECVKSADVLKNRFVIGYPLSESSTLSNYKAEDLGLGVGPDIRIAKGIMRMRRSGSGVKYVHGGSALQEIVVPVVDIQHVRNREEDVAPVEAEILVDGAGRITTNRFGVSVYQASPVGEEFCRRIVRLGLHAPDGKLLSDEVQLVLDSEAENVPDRTKSTMLTLNRAANDMRVGAVELRMETGKERGASGRVDWDVYKVKPMTLRLAVQNFFD